MRDGTKLTVPMLDALFKCWLCRGSWIAPRPSERLAFMMLFGRGYVERSWPEASAPTYRISQTGMQRLLTPAVLFEEK